MAQRKGKLELEKVSSQKKLHIKAREKGSIRVGSTETPYIRKGTYEVKGYSGTMYFAKTSNMMKAEDKLLAIKTFLYNKQKYSNVPEEKGYVYVIQGRKYK